VAGSCQWQKQDVDCAFVGATCGTAPSQDGGGDAAVELLTFRKGDVIGCVLPAPPAPAPPQVSCDEDASGDAALCSPPASVCADDYWLVYYDNGQCVSGQCTWQTPQHYCDYGCIDGACRSRPTVPANPPI
jgi:hypothetical protein